MEKTSRKSNLELMRVFAIFLIVVFHASMDLDNTINFKHVFVPNMIPIFAFGSWGRVGVGLFIIVSAWFLVDKKTDLKIGSKFIKISGVTIFYALLIPCVYKVLGIKAIGMGEIIKAVISPFIDSYWYVSSYLMLLLFYPFFNKCIHSLNDKELKRITGTLIIISDLWGTIVPTRVATVCGEFMTFVTLYFIVAFLKKNPDNWFMKKSGIKAIAVYIFIVGICILFDLLGTKVSGVFLSVPVRIVNNNSIFIDVFAILVFCWFYNLDINNNRLLNTIAKTTLGVYVIHTTSTFSSDGWDKIFYLGKNFNEDNVFMFTIHLFGAAIIVLIVCIIVDLIRIYFIERWVFEIKPIKNILNKVDALMSVNLCYDRKEKK